VSSVRQQPSNSENPDRVPALSGFVHHLVHPTYGTSVALRRFVCHVGRKSATAHGDMVPRYNEYGLDVRRMLVPFGSPTDIQRRLYERGIARVDAKTVEKWIQRGSIPVDGLICMVLLGRAEGRPIDILDLIRTEGQR
jgi:hypothetical protein